MSCLENEVLEERLSEEFDNAFSGDWDLRNALAVLLLDGVDFYLYCKDDNQELLDDHYEDIYEKVEEAFWKDDEACFDIRVLCERAFNIEIG